VFGHLRRNLRLLALFAVIVLIPAITFGVLIARAVRSDRREAVQKRAERQQQIAQLVETDLNDWLFSTGPASARSQAVVRFRSTTDRVVFDDFGLSLPIDGAARPRPLQNAELSGAPNADALLDFYYPRIVVFLRDIKAHTQYFQRLHAVIVRLQDGSGYVIDTGAVAAHVNARLVQLGAATNVQATFSIADVRDNRPRAGVTTLGLKDYPFFQIDFAPDAEAASVPGYAFTYAMTLVVALTLLGSVFLYRAISQEVRLSRLRTDFVSAVSHEFRSPLSSILALSERLTSARVTDPAKLAEYHSLIGSSAGRLSSLVTRLLDFAQIEQGRKIYSQERLDLVTAARDAVQASRDSMTTHPIELDAETAAPLWVNADRLAVHHCVHNLLENAAKYSPPGSTIRVTCAPIDGFNTIEVRDQGIGIAPAEQGRIFEKFYRGRDASRLGVQGVGIGLALVKHMMESHHGSVDVHSVPGQGSRFRLSFPRVEG
jgi:two-component system phosphate regulon sensor histidine kinase PhoR